MKHNPEHYRQGAIEPWDFIVSQRLGFLEGNIIKYIVRAGKKDGETKIDDLAKAATYLRKLIETTPDEQDAPGPDGPSNQVPPADGAADRSIQPGGSLPSAPSDFRGVPRVR